MIHVVDDELAYKDAIYMYNILWWEQVDCSIGPWTSEVRSYVITEESSVRVSPLNEEREFVAHTFS